ncbi:MAG: KpsF/GutQ family sugar-phosphate isomerase [Gammaproteobacteria bacterium]
MKTSNKQFARQILNKEISALRRTAKLINNDFDEACQILSNIDGKVVTLGMGKSSFVAMKMAATLSSTGTSALFLHPADALHGDIGVIKKNDAVIIYSNSGETEEIIKLLPLLKILKCSLISITGNIKSTLAKHSKVLLDASVEKEACPNNLAPTSSIVCALAISDALALTVAEKNNFSVQDFAKTHPEGALGKRLLITVSDIMTKKNIPLLKVTDKFINLIKKTTKSNLGLAVVVDNKNNIQGVISDGDIKRIMQKNTKFTDLILKDIMTTDPLLITPDSLAAEALNIMEENNIDAIPVIEKRKILGIVTLKEIIKSIN